MKTSLAPSRAVSASSKVTYSLPRDVVGEVERRSRAAGLAKSELVREALTAYFARLDREVLGRIYGEAAADRLFVADNAAVQDDFAALEEEAAVRSGR